MILTITPLSGGATEIAAPPDILWNGTVGDFGPDPDRGLSSSQPLETAILLLLFTDAPADVGELQYEHRGDFRGWPGDALGASPLGSKLWLYRRRELTDHVALLVKAEITRALLPLIDQEAVARIDVDVFPNKGLNRMDAAISVYGRDGLTKYANRFNLLWQGR